MVLYLVQHGRGRPKSEDPLQGLSKERAADARRIAEVAAHYRVRVSVILHSGKERAAQTAEIFSAALHPHPPKGVRQIDGIIPMDDFEHHDFYFLTIPVTPALRRHDQVAAEVTKRHPGMIVADGETLVVAQGPGRHIRRPRRGLGVRFL
jgi:broad specificity phosphatase PhoE